MKAAISYGSVQEDLGLVEAALGSLRDVDFVPLAQMMDVVLSGGGKRLRPALALLAGKFGRYDLELLVPLAASIVARYSKFKETCRLAVKRNGKEEILEVMALSETESDSYKIEIA